HFIEWCEDLAPTGLPALKVHRFLPDPSNSMMSLLYGDNVETEEFTAYPPSPTKYTMSPKKNVVDQSYGPIKTPAVEDLFLLDHPATPTAKRVMTPLPLPQRDLTDEEAFEYSRYVDASEEHLFSAQSDTILPPPPALLTALDCLESKSGQPDNSNSARLPLENDIPQPSLGSIPKSSSPSVSLRSETPPSVSQSLTGPCGESVSAWQVSERVECFVNGKMKTTCAGKLCLKKHDPPKPAQQCSFLFCKSCCRAYQIAQHIPCKCPGHKLDSSTATTSTTSQNQLDEEPNFARPLNPIHYTKHERAVEHYRHRAQTVTSQWVYQEENSKAVDITFWNETGNVEDFTVTVATFPLFKLSDSPEFVREAIGPSPEIFHAETGRWRRADITVPRLIVSGETVLYRSAQKYGQNYEFAVSDEMTALINSQTQLRSTSNLQASSKPVKRKAPEVSEGDIRSPVRPRFDDSLLATQHSTDSLSSKESPEPKSYPDPRPSAEAITMPPAAVMDRKELTAAQMVERASGHAPWPLKYFKPMMEGIERSSRMSGSESELEKHRLAFPMSTASESTLARWMKFWHGGSKEVKKRFGVQYDSTWKGFCHAVAGEYPGGVVPGLKQQRGLKKSSINVKSEGGNTPVKIEEAEVIVIDE
ncbi:hypothetical protein PQX77_019467, partial [Marasmius sp. AFHP31]